MTNNGRTFFSFLVDILTLIDKKMSSSTSSTATNILFATKQYTIYGYFTILFLGLVGNTANLIIFTSLKIFRKNQYAFYINIESIMNFALLILALPFRVTEYAFAYDTTRLSLAWCKLRPTTSHTLALMSFSVICFAAMDQYFSTNPQPWLRQLSTLKLARRLTLAAFVIWSLYDSIFLIYFDIQDRAGCAIYNFIVGRYYSFGHFITLNGLLPILISSTFSLLAYSNVRRIVQLRIPLVRRKLDKQLTAMILAKVAFLVFTILPSIILRIYILNFTAGQTDPIRLAVDQFISTFSYSLFYMNTAVSRLMK